VVPHASKTLGEALRTTLVVGTAASEIVASAAASNFLVFDI